MPSTRNIHRFGVSQCLPLVVLARGPWLRLQPVCRVPMGNFDRLWYSISFRTVAGSPIWDGSSRWYARHVKIKTWWGRLGNPEELSEEEAIGSSCLQGAAMPFRHATIGSQTTTVFPESEEVSLLETYGLRAAWNVHHVLYGRRHVQDSCCV